MVMIDGGVEKVISWHTFCVSGIEYLGSLSEL